MYCRDRSGGELVYAKNSAFFAKCMVLAHPFLPKMYFPVASPELSVYAVLLYLCAGGDSGVGNHLWHRSGDLANPAL